MEAGRTTRLAKHFNRSLGAITQWRTNGVPRNLMRRVMSFTNGEVTLEDMVPERCEDLRPDVPWGVLRQSAEPANAASTAIESVANQEITNV